MRVGWLQDAPGYIGGAEMTAAEFRAAAPEDVQIIDCPPGGIDYDCDSYVAHNVVQYSLDEIESLGRVVKYSHDVFPHAQPGVREWFVENAEWIFCSPLQRDHMRIDGRCIPPAMDVSGYAPPRQSKRRREGTVSIAQWRNPGKGAHLIEGWARQDGPIDVYGPGPCLPAAEHTRYRGELPQDKVAQTLWDYEAFVFLPYELEPFCRTVIEAHAAGCQIITNGLIGASHYLRDEPEKLSTAAEDFWGVVCAVEMAT